MRDSKVLKKLRSGQAVSCFKSAYALPDIVELMGLLGADVVWICNEHIPIGAERTKEIMRAGRAADIDILYRRAFNGYDRYIQLLEAGCSGIMTPHCSSAAMAEEIVDAIKFSPLGHRGLDGIGADADFGIRPLAEYMNHANRETFLTLQVENAEAVDCIEEIASVPGVDIIFIGPADLAQSLGCPGDLKNPAIRQVIRRCVKACNAHGIFCGTAGIDVEYMGELLDMGVRFITWRSDYAMIRDSLRSDMRIMEKMFR